MKIRPLLLVLSLSVAAGACQVDRTLPSQRYACGFGGPCDDDASIDDDAGELPEAGPSDAGDAGARDAGDGGRDAGRDGGADGGRDAGSRDATPTTACSLPTPMPAGGIATGDTRSLRDTLTGMCATAPGGRDIVYRFDLPFLVPELRISTAGSSFDTLLYVFREQCAATAEIACDDDGLEVGRGSEVRIPNAAAGRYYIGIDGKNAGSYGNYVLDVSATLADGALCSRDYPLLACDTPSACRAVSPTELRCARPLDCMDGFDNDGDTQIDEDTCTDPPLSTCAAAATFDPSLYISIPALGASSAALIDQQWTLVETPSPNFETQFFSNHSDTALMLPELAGRYLSRYQAVDAAGQATACEVETFVRTGGDLLVELFWPTPQFADLDVHLLSPRATRWDDPAEDCASRATACAAGELDWGAAGAADNPVSSGDILDPGPERIRITEPERATYRVGVHARSAPVGATAYVRVHCKDRVQEFGPVTLTGTTESPAAAQFWKVADVTVGANTCTITSLASGTNPLVVTTDAAQAAR